MENTENMIDFISGRRIASVSFTNRKHINRIKAIYSERPEEFKFFHENEDGSVFAQIPLRWVKINPGAKKDPDKPKREMSPEQKSKLQENLARARAAKQKKK